MRNLYFYKMYLKLCFCLFVGVLLFGYSESYAITTPIYRNVNSPEVNIIKSKEMPAEMQRNAVEAFKQAYEHLITSEDRCSIVRQIFNEKYPNYKWQVAMYKSYSIQSIKSIDVKVNNDKFILFAPKV